MNPKSVFHHRTLAVLLASVGVVGAAIAVGRLGPPPPSESDVEAELVEIVSSTPADLGQLPSMAQAAREVVLRNTVDFPIQIEVRGANCGCLTAEVSPNLLEPGEAATFRLSTEVHPDEKGVQGYAAWLEAFDPRYPKVQQNIVVNMQFIAAVEYYVYPTRLTVHQELPSAGEATFIVRPYAVDNIKILAVESDHPDAVTFDAKAVTIGHGDGAKVRVITNFEDEGSYLGQVRVKTDCEKYPEFLVPLYVRVGPPPGSTRTLVLDGASGRSAASAVIGIEELEKAGGAEASDFIFDPPVSGLVARLEEDKGITVSCRFEETEKPAGTTELVLLGPQGHELARYTVAWIGSLDRLAAELDAPASGAEGIESDR